MLNRDTVISKAIDECLTEMYDKAQPSANYHDYVEKAKRGEITKNELIYERHYLNETQFNYIANKYKEAYRCINEWKSNIDFLVKCLKEGGYKDVWIKDEDGMGHRSGEKTPTLNEIVGEDKAIEVFKLIEDLKNFYRFDREEEVFSFNVYLGCSPTSNAEKVKDYWKSQGIDIQIDETELSEDDYWEIDKYGHVLKDEDE